MTAERKVFYEDLRLLNLEFEEGFQKIFNRFLESGWYILGKEVELFERSFAEYCGSKYCVGVASGLDALILSIQVLDLPPKSEIIVASNTYIATILAIIRAGHTPILVEPSILTLNINPERIIEKINDRTKAIIAVHLYGKMCEMDELQTIANENGLFLIEDAAQAHGATYKGRRAGSLGHLAAFSFYPTKNLGCLGDGGCITTDNEEFAIQLYALRNYGSDRKYHNKYIGQNSRLDEIQAAILHYKLDSLSRINDHKRKLARIYFTELQDLNLTFPHLNDNLEDVFHIFPIRIKNRDAFRSDLSKSGITTEVHYPIAPHRQPAYQPYLPGSYPISDLIHETVISLPISFAHNEEDVRYVCEQIRLQLWS